MVILRLIEWFCHPLIAQVVYKFDIPRAVKVKIYQECLK